MIPFAATLEAARSRALATLARKLGDIDAAEDAVQEATVRALATWPRRGVPQNPVGWLVRAGLNTAIDAVRHQRMSARHNEAIVGALPGSDAASDAELLDRALGQQYDDDLVRLILTCCDPVLTQREQVALTLKTVAGLSLEDVAAALLVKPRTMEQRLTRAKRKIRDAAVPYAVPAASALPQRIDAVLAVLYLVFNAGYKASHGEDVIRPDVCALAIRLCRVVAGLARGHTEVVGLLALMLLTHARAPARLDGHGDMVPLEQQDRGQWDRRMMDEGLALLEKALLYGAPGPFQVQAAIAGVHAKAAAAAQTDWREIVVLYEALERMQPTPVVTVGRAVAVARAQGVDAGLAVLDTLEGVAAMTDYQPFHVVRAGMLAEAGQRTRASEAYARAVALTESAAERAYLRRQIDALARGDPSRA